MDEFAQTLKDHLGEKKEQTIVLHVRNALDFTIPKQFSELLSSIGKWVVYHNLCAYPHFPTPNITKKKHYDFSVIFQNFPSLST